MTGMKAWSRRTTKAFQGEHHFNRILLHLSCTDVSIGQNVKSVVNARPDVMPDVNVKRDMNAETTTVTMEAEATMDDFDPMRKPMTFQERSRLRKMLMRVVLRFTSPQRSSLRRMRKWMFNSERRMLDLFPRGRTGRYPYFALRCVLEALSFA